MRVEGKYVTGQVCEWNEYSILFMDDMLNVKLDQNSVLRLSYELYDDESALK